MIEVERNRNNLSLKSGNLQMIIKSNVNTPDIITLILIDNSPNNTESIFDAEIGEIRNITTIIKIADTEEYSAYDAILNILDSHPIFSIFYLDILNFYNT